jgi:glycosyltransferase involved in cell wall biosynthesis
MAVSLPAPPEGKTGWPWEAPPIQSCDRSGSALPKISIITPSLNQGAFIEETIRSVLLQGYPSLELIIIDGGSTDQTLEILRRYEQFLAYWISDPDRGQSHAVNKGLAKATGDVIGWLNSDDIYCPDTFHQVASVYTANPTSIIAGTVLDFDGTKEWLSVTQDGFVNGITTFWRPEAAYHQPGVFIPRSILAEVGPLDESLVFCMDFDLYCRLEQRQVKAVVLQEVLAKFRRHPASKTSTLSKTHRVEQPRVCKRYIESPELLSELDFKDVKWISSNIGECIRSNNFSQLLEEVHIAPQVGILGKLAAFVAKEQFSRLRRRLSCT